MGGRKGGWSPSACTIGPQPIWGPIVQALRPGPRAPGPGSGPREGPGAWARSTGVLAQWAPKSVGGPIVQALRCEPEELVGSSCVGAGLSVAWDAARRWRPLLGNELILAPGRPSGAPKGLGGRTGLVTECLHNGFHIGGGGHCASTLGQPAPAPPASRPGQVPRVWGKPQGLMGSNRGPLALPSFPIPRGASQEVGGSQNGGGH